MNVLQQVAALKLLPVIKLDRAKDAAPLAEALCAGKLPVAEVTFRTDAAAASIETMTSWWGRDRSVRSSRRSVPSTQAQNFLSARALAGGSWNLRYYIDSPSFPVSAHQPNCCCCWNTIFRWRSSSRRLNTAAWLPSKRFLHHSRSCSLCPPAASAQRMCGNIWSFRKSLPAAVAGWSRAISSMPVSLIPFAA